MNQTVDTKWDKPRDLLEDMIRNMRELERTWPGIANHDLRQYWHREIDRAAQSLQMLRQAAVSGQELDRIHEQRERARWADV